MSSRGAALVALGAAAGLLIWLVLAVGDREERALEDVYLYEAEKLPTPEVDVEDPELEPAPFLESDEEETTRTAELVEQAAPPDAAVTAIPEASPDSAPVRGILRDAATGEALPLYALRIQGSAGPWEDVMTDEDGRFTTGSPMVGSTIRITPYDDPGHKRSLPAIAVERRVEEGAAPELDLSVAAGPTYRLSISPGSLVPTRLTAYLRLRNFDDTRNLGPEPLRAGDTPWVRFAPVPEDFDRCDRIEIRDEEGLWFGTAKVSAIRGIVPGFVDVVLEARAALVGKIVDPQGVPVEAASVVFQGEAASGKTYERRVSSRYGGEFRFRHLVGGSGTLAVRALRHVGQDAAVRLLPGAITQQDFILAPLPSAGSIRGRLESETGRYNTQTELVLRPVSARAVFETEKVSWEEHNGRRSGVFEFDALPAGEYEIAVQVKDWFSWNPPKLLASPPFDGARFVVHDDLAHAEFAFRPRDAETGASLDAFAWFNVRGGSSDSKHVVYGGWFLARFPLEKSFRWRLDRQGYRPAFGDEKAFAVEELRNERLWKIAEIELEPGWGEVYRVVRRNNKKPIAGAKILLDGREAGTTKADGTCRVEAREKPGSVEIDYRGWKVASPVDMRPSWKRKEKRFVDIEVAPPPRN